LQEESDVYYKMKKELKKKEPDGVPGEEQCVGETTRL
jgi:hypothetical protein